MNICIINCSPRSSHNGNTDKIIDAFIKGLHEKGETVESFNLSYKKQWKIIIDSINNTQHIIFALPLFVECIPGLMVEFLEILAKHSNIFDKKEKGISFILHSGFPEASQRRCCEKYLKQLPELLNCKFSGILSHGDSFALSILESNSIKELLRSYESFAHKYVGNGYNFLFNEAIEFTGKEYYTDSEAKSHNRIVKFFLDRLTETV